MVEILIKYRAQLAALLVMLTVGAGFMFFREEIQPLLSMIKNGQAHPALLIGCFLVLPMMFFPITILLVLIGVRFDAVAGMLIMFMIMPAHLLFSFFVVRSIFRSQLERFARKKKYAIFNIPAKRQLGFAFVFMAVPGLPYAVKNYLLPISGIPFREYFLISWLVNGAMGIPFVVLGHAASKWNIHVLLILIFLLGAAYFIAHQVRKRYSQMDESTSDR
jgi:uncharacterized membrane protein YdjX (TVP38/TMEM64 family)